MKEWRQTIQENMGRLLASIELPNPSSNDILKWTEAAEECWKENEDSGFSPLEVLINTFTDLCDQAID